METNAAEQLYLFYDHNSPLLFFGGVAFLCLFIAFTRKSNYRFYMVLFIALLILTFKFEYDKHLVAKLKDETLNAIFPPETRYRKYNFIVNFLDYYLPMLMDLVGWGLLSLTLLIGPRDRNGNGKSTS